MSGLHFGVTADTTNFMRKLQEVENKLQDFASTVESEGGSIDALFQKITKAAAAMGVAFSAKEFVSKVAQVRGEFQQLEVAFNTMLGSEEKANALMKQLVQTAAITPFGLEDVTNGAKQLLAYGLEAEKVNETLTRLGDIAAGLSIPFNDLAYLYGTTMVQGRMYTQDLNQFLGRGIPLTEELAKQFGVTSDKVKDLVTAGKVGFPEVEKAIVSMTSEGGKFGGLMEAQSKTITGQIGNIEDAIQSMFNEIGKSSEGLINAGLSVTSALVENWQKVGEAIMVAATAYGTYKAVVMTVAAVQKMEIAVLREAVLTRKLIALENAKVGATQIVMSNAEVVALARTKMLTAAQKGLAASLKAVAKATLLNPYVLIAAAITGLIYTIYKFATAESVAEKALNKYNEEKQKAIEKENEHKEAMDKLLSTAEDEAASTELRTDALRSLEKYYPQIFAKYNTELEILKNIKKIKEDIAKEEAKNSITNLDNELYNVNKEINALQAKDKANAKEETTYAYGEEVKIKRRGISDDEIARLEALKKKRDELQKQQKAKRVDDYFADLTGVSDEELKMQIAKRKTILADLKHTGKRFGAIKDDNKDLQGVFRKETIQAQQKVLERELNRRTATKGASSKWVEEAKKKYEADLKAYNDFVTSKSNEYSKEEFEKERDRLKGVLATSKAEYDKSKKEGNGSKGSTSNAAKELAEYKRLTEKNAQERARLQQDLETQVEDARIAAMDDGAEKTLAEMEQNFEKEMRAIDRQKAEYLQKKKDLARSEFEKNPANKGKAFDDSSVTLTDDENKQFEKLYKAKTDAYEKSQNEIRMADLQSLRDYLKEYGTFQQKKYAIAQEYAEKIRKAQTEGERMSLGKERDAKLADVESQALNTNINWEVVFGEFGGMFADVIRPELEKLREYTKTSEFTNADDASKQAIIEAITKMEDSLKGTGSLNFKQLGADIKAYQSALKQLELAQATEKESLEKLAEAQEEYEEALKSGNEEQKAQAKKALDTAKTNADAASANVQTQTDLVNQSQQDVAGTAKDLSKGMKDVLSNLQGLASGNIKDGVNGFIGIMSKAPGKIGDAFSKVSDKLESVPIIGWILSIIDILKDGLSNLVGSLLDSILNAVGGIIEDIFSGNLLKTIINSLANGLTRIGKALVSGLSFGFINLGGADYTALNELKEKYEALSEIWDELIDKKQEYIGISYGTESIQAADEALALLARKSEYARNLAKEAAGAGASVGSHSIAARQNKYLKNWKSQLDQYTGTPDLSLTDSLLYATPEQLSKIKDEMYEMWMELDDTFRTSLEDLIACDEKAAEIKDKLKEAMTGVSFDSFYNDFVEMLKDLDSKNKDFADSFEEYLQNAIFSSLLANQYKKRIQALYDKWSEYANDNDNGIGNSGLTRKEADKIREEYKNIVNDMLADRDNINEIFGFSASATSQSASTKGFESMSQDTANELNGRFTAVQESNENISNQLIAAVECSRSILSAVTDGNGILNAILLQHVATNGYLEDIAKYAKPLLEVGGKLDKIINNTKNL